MTKVYAHFMYVKLVFVGHMKSRIKKSSVIGVKFEPEFLMSISWILSVPTLTRQGWW